jgi:hypothetical protein
MRRAAELPKVIRPRHFIYRTVCRPARNSPGDTIPISLQEQFPMTIDPSSGYPFPNQMAAVWAGDNVAQADTFIRDMDAAMRDNYATNIVKIGEDIYPFLYTEATYDGGCYTLLVDDRTSYVKQSADPIYDQAKALCHIPLGIFAIISGYAKDSRYKQWLQPLTDYRAKVSSVAQTLEVLPLMNSKCGVAARTILVNSLHYLDSLISGQENFLSFVSFKAYCEKLNPFIAVLQMAAAQNQVEVFGRILTTWKAMFTEADWDKLYVVVSVIWPLTHESAHEQIVKSFMKPALQDTNMIVSEAATTLDMARTLMGRILGDRILAPLVFDKSQGLQFAEDIYSLSTQRDLMSQVIKTSLGTCPVIR